jgi:hypothetical protein
MMELVNKNFKIAIINMFMDLKETLNVKRRKMNYTNKRMNRTYSIEKLNI